MTQTEIKKWLGYWQRAGMVSVDKIQSLQDVVQARKFCKCMRVGRFTIDQVSDLQIWRAIQSIRLAARAAA